MIISTGRRARCSPSAGAQRPAASGAGQLHRAEVARQVRGGAQRSRAPARTARAGERSLHVARPADHVLVGVDGGLEELVDAGVSQLVGDPGDAIAATARRPSGRASSGRAARPTGRARGRSAAPRDRTPASGTSRSSAPGRRRPRRPSSQLERDRLEHGAPRERRGRRRGRGASGSTITRTSPTWLDQPCSGTTAT